MEMVYPQVYNIIGNFDLLGGMHYLPWWWIFDIMRKGTGAFIIESSRYDVLHMFIIKISSLLVKD